MRFWTIVQTHPSLPSGMTTTISRDPPSSCAICCSEDAVATVHLRGSEPLISSSIAWVFWFLEWKSSSSAVVPVLQFLKTANCHFFLSLFKVLEATFLPCGSWTLKTRIELSLFFLAFPEDSEISLYAWDSELLLTFSVTVHEESENLRIFTRSLESLFMSPFSPFRQFILQRSQKLYRLLFLGPCDTVQFFVSYYFINFFSCSYSELTQSYSKWYLF